MNIYYMTLYNKPSFYAHIINRFTIISAINFM